MNSLSEQTSISTGNPVPEHSAADALQGSGLRPVTMPAPQPDRRSIDYAYDAVLWDLRARGRDIDRAIKALENLRDMRAARGARMLTSHAEGL